MVATQKEKVIASAEIQTLKKCCRRYVRRLTEGWLVSAVQWMLLACFHLTDLVQQSGRVNNTTRCHCNAITSVFDLVCDDKFS